MTCKTWVKIVGLAVLQSRALVLGVAEVVLAAEKGGKTRAMDVMEHSEEITYMLVLRIPPTIRKRQIIKHKVFMLK